MLHSVTVSNAVTSYQSSSTNLNRVYWIRAKNAENHPRNQNKVSTKILGFGVFMIGVVILAMGLIMGVEFPKHVKQKIIKNNCILNKEHDFYEKWVRDSSYTRYNRIYYWEIQNPDDFLRGTTPIFSEKGPYVYLERRTRLHVIFNDNVVSYRTMFTQTFSERHTRAECGSTCSENDMITTLNTDFLRKLHAFGSWAKYIRAYQPAYITALFRNWTVVHGDSQRLLEVLSCATSQCDRSLHLTNNGSFLLEKLLSFGTFVSQNNSNEKRTILDSSIIVNASGYIDTSVIRSMYDHVTIAAESVSGSCAGEIANVSWKVRLNRTDNPSLPYSFSKVHPDVDEIERTAYLSKHCDFSEAVTILTDYLFNFSDWSDLQWSFVVCEEHTNSCDIILETQGTILALLSVAKDFVQTYLLKTISTLVLPLTENSIVHTKPQSDLATGYSRQRVESDPDPREDADGVLVNHVDAVDAFRKSPEVVVGTCLEHEDKNNNMIVRKYNDSEQTPPGVYSGGTRSVSGYIGDFPPANECLVCTKPYPNTLVHDVFLRDLVRSVKFEFTDEIWKYSNRLHSYQIKEGAFGGSASCDLINTTAVHKFPSFVGRPVFDKSGCEHLTSQLHSRSKDFTSTIEIEPRTGKFWFENVRLQTSAVILPEMLAGVDGRLYPHLVAVSTPIPLYWVDRQAQIGMEDIQYFEYNVDRQMSVSCGGLVGLLTLSILIVILSVFVGMLSTRKNKVHIMPEEPSISTCNRA